MKSSLLWRRLAGGAAVLLIALSGALATMAPAQAQQTVDAQAAFLDVCDATYVLFVSDLALEWSVRVDGADYWPQDGDQQPGPGELGVVYVPSDADTIRVNFQGSTSDWPREHSWIYPGGECDALPEVTFSQPTCEVDVGEILIPGFGEDWLINGEPVPPGSAQPVSPGTYVVEVIGWFFLGHLLDGWEDEEPLKVPGATWIIEIEAPDCPGAEEDEDESEEEDEREGEDEGAGGADGEGGELARTGGVTGPLAGTAAVLLLVGGTLYVSGRRRAIFVA